MIFVIQNLNKMKIRLLLFAALLIAGNSFAQKGKKSNKKQAQKELSAQSSRDVIGEILETKEFDFLAHVIYPLGMPSRNLGGENYSVSFSKDEIVSVLPYYGSVKSGAFGAGATEGLNFKGKPTKFNIRETKKGYTVHVEVNSPRDDYTLILKVERTGHAKLTVSSRSKQSTTFQGEVLKSKDFK